MHGNIKITTVISPSGVLDVLSQHEVAKLRDASVSGLHETLRRCCLAVLTSGSEKDDAIGLLEEFADFDVNVLQRDRGVKLEVINAPASAFVEGKIIKGIRELLFAVLRDIIYVSNESELDKFDLTTSDGITNFVFHILRNAGILKSRKQMDIVACWGGHSINRAEYDYSKKIGYELGLRSLNICTGCGPGAMKGPMKGATISHAKQRIRDGRYIGVTEPGIIAAEAPNAIVNELVIMPDIEKRLEAFVRISHGIIVFPGGVGTAEEILYILGILLHPNNQDIHYPLVFTGPETSRDYFELMDKFLSSVLGDLACQRYKIIINDPAQVAFEMRRGIDEVMRLRRQHSDAFYYNWRLYIDSVFQRPFDATHENMAGLNLHLDQLPHELAANLRCAFSGLVAGNVKAQGILEIKKRGPFSIRGDTEIMAEMDTLLATFADQNRMKLPGSKYVPCYQLVL